MLYCTFCGAEIPEDASFCGNCGQIPAPAPDGQTRISGVRRVELQQVAGNGGSPGNSTPTMPPIWEYDQSPNYDDQSTIPIADDEEERRRRAAMVGMGLLAGVDMLPTSSVPMVQGTPQIGGVPTVANPPMLQDAVAGGPIPPGWQSGPATYIPQASGYTPPVPTSSLPTQTLHHPPYPRPKPQPKGGCAPLLIIAILIPFVLIGSIVTLGFTVLAPALSLSGSSTVTSGGTLALHGDHFLPGSSITLTLDGTTPLFVAAHPADRPVARSIPGALNATAAQLLQPGANNTINADGNGTFSVSISVDPSWSSGQHTIQASEAITHRGAQLTFTIVSGGSTPTPTSTATATVTPSPTLSPTVSPSATASTAALSCVNPSSITLGPVSANYTQAVSQTVSLCTSGTGSLNWTASWNQGQAPWLAFDHSAGTISAPGQATITVFANASRMTAGTYSAPVTFSSQPGSVTESLTVNFIVQAGCITTSAKTLNFNAVLHVSEAPTQTVSLANCGAVGNWSASVKTSDGASWLSATPTSGTLNGNASVTITIGASTLNSTLVAGVYSGTVTFTASSTTVTVNITFNVQSGPMLSVSEARLIGNNPPCQLSPTAGIYICYVTITNTSSTLSLNWTSSTNLLPGAGIKPGSGTLAPGQSEPRVLIEIPASDCSNGASVTFSGPANSVTLPWTCQLIT